MASSLCACCALNLQELRWFSCWWTLILKPGTATVHWVLESKGTSVPVLHLLHPRDSLLGVPNWLPFRSTCLDEQDPLRTDKAWHLEAVDASSQRLQATLNAARAFTDN